MCIEIYIYAGIAWGRCDATFPLSRELYGSEWRLVSHFLCFTMSPPCLSLSLSLWFGPSCVVVSLFPRAWRSTNMWVFNVYFIVNLTKKEFASPASFTSRNTSIEKKYSIFFSMQWILWGCLIAYAGNFVLFSSRFASIDFFYEILQVGILGDFSWISFATLYICQKWFTQYFLRIGEMKKFVSIWIITDWNEGPYFLRKLIHWSKYWPYPKKKNAKRKAEGWKK